jgi:hypothetical protein
LVEKNDPRTKDQNYHAACVSVNHEDNLLSIIAGPAVHLPALLYKTLAEHNLLDGSFHTYACERNGKNTTAEVCVRQLPPRDSFKARVEIVIAFISDEGSENEEIQEFGEIFVNGFWYSNWQFLKMNELQEPIHNETGNCENFTGGLSDLQCQEMTPGVELSILQQLFDGKVIENIPTAIVQPPCLTTFHG